MIVYNNSISVVPCGRDTQSVKSNFYLKELPSWLTCSSEPTWSDNGAAVNGVVSTSEMLMDKVEEVKLELFNCHWSSIPTDPSFRLVSDNGEYIGLTGDTFEYFDGEDKVINEEVGLVDNKKVWSWCSNVHLTNFATGSKNVSIVIQPQYGYYHVLCNNEPVHSRHVENLQMIGSWHWEVYSGGKAIHISSIEMSIQQNI